MWYEETSIKYICDEYFFVEQYFLWTNIFTHSGSLVSCASNHQHAASTKTFNNSSFTVLRLIWNLRVSSYGCVSLPLSCFVFEWFYSPFLSIFLHLILFVISVFNALCNGLQCYFTFCLCMHAFWVKIFHFDSTLHFQWAITFEFAVRC